MLNFGRVAWGVLGLALVACEGEVPYCGNGRLEAGEGCDDGNGLPGDGCDARCNIENGQRLTDMGCMVDFEAYCPVDAPQCGLLMSGGICIGRGQVKCRFFGDGALAVLPGIFPTVLDFDHPVSSASLYFAHMGQSHGIIRFFDEDDEEILAFTTISNCDQAAPGPVTVRLPRGAVRAEIHAIGGPVFLDDIATDVP
jgi:cysteine-rich repeat protein